MTSVLVVDDEERIRSFLERGLRAAGYTVTGAATGGDALAYLDRADFDLVLLDIGLPGIEGVEVLRRLRDRGDPVPVILVTARAALDDVVEGLDAGADDYLVKPFKLDELLARVRARLRDQDAPRGAELSHADVVLDLQTRRVRVSGRDEELSAREFSLLETLMRHPGQVLSREQLLSRVWGIEFETGSNVVDVYVGYLRSKIGVERIETVRGVGYRLV